MKVFIYGLIATALVIAVGCALYFFTSSFLNRETVETHPVTVRLNWLHQAQFTGFYVAKEKGFYAEEGLEVTLKEFDFDKSDIGKELEENGVDFAVMSAQELVTAVDSGNAVKSVAVIYQTSPYAFASLTDANIKTPGDLRGKILGLAGGNQQARVTYKALLNQFGVNENEVTFKDLGFDTPEDVITRQADIVDLYRTDQTYLLNQRGTSYDLLLPEQFDFGIYGDAITTTNAHIQNDPELVRKFVAATLRGWEYALDHQDEALSIVNGYANEQYRDPLYEQHILTQSAPLIRPIGKQEIGGMQYLKWKKAIDAMHNAGVTTQKLDANDLYTTDFLRQ